MKLRSVCIGLFSLAGHTYAQHAPVQFQQLAPKDGLSQATITAITQDSRGFLWFGTSDGLNRYDGYEFENYYHDSHDSTTLSNSEISALASTQQGDLWVGTQAGINLYQAKYDRFLRLPASGLLDSLPITQLLAMQDGSLWVGTPMGLFHMAATGHIIEHYKGPPHLPHPVVTALAWEPTQNTLWIGTHEGLVRLQIRPDQGRKFEILPVAGLAQVPIRALTTATQGTLFVGTDGGLIRLNQSSEGGWLADHMHHEGVLSLGHCPQQKVLWVGSQNGLFRYPQDGLQLPEKYEAQSLDRNSISDNQVISIFQSKEGIWWFGASSGLNYFDPVAIKFSNYALAENAGLDLVDNKVWAVTSNQDGDLYLATESGLVQLQLNGTMIRHKADPINPKALQEGRVRSLAWGPEGNLWVGTEYGLQVYDPDRSEFRHMLLTEDSRSNINTANLIRTLWWESPQRLWCGTKEGIFIVNPQGNVVEVIRAEPDNPNALQNNQIIFFYQDREEQLWIGTLHGLHHRRGDSNTFDVYLHDPNRSSSLANNNLRSMIQDTKGRRWVGSKGGLDLMLDSGRFKHYTVADGLPNHVIYGILEDNKGRLWLSTNRGLSLFSPDEESFRNFDLSDGLQGLEFNTQSAGKTPDGRLLFGGINGLNAFDPDSLAFNEYAPPTYITGIDLFGAPVELGSHTMPYSPLVLDTLRLNHRQDFLTIHFTGLSYTQSTKNRYQYRLLGFQDEWLEVGASRAASFTNLPGGDFIFEVRSANNDLIWNEEPTRLVILVAPALWETTGFRLVVLIVLLIITVALFQQRFNAIKRQKSRLEALVAKRTSQIEAQKVSLEQQAQQLRKNLEDTKSLANIGRSITSHRKGMDLVKFVFRQLNTIMDVEVLTIGLFDHEQQGLDILGMRQPNLPIPHHFHSLKEDHLTGIWSFKYQTPLFLNNYPEEYPRLIADGMIPKLTDNVPGSVIYSPFYRDENPRGFVGVHSMKTDAYSQFEFDVLRNLASYIAIALDNASAYHQIRRQKEEIERMNANLEQKVQDRTMELEVQKNKLEEFAQINAHKVRRPLAAMMGLVPLLRWAKPYEQDNLLQSLEVSSQELDEMVHRMNQILTEQGILSPEELTKE